MIIRIVLLFLSIFDFICDVRDGIVSAFKKIYGSPTRVSIAPRHTTMR